MKFEELYQLLREQGEERDEHGKDNYNRAIHGATLKLLNIDTPEDESLWLDILKRTQQLVRKHAWLNQLSFTHIITRAKLLYPSIKDGANIDELFNFLDGEYTAATSSTDRARLLTADELQRYEESRQSVGYDLAHCDSHRDFANRWRGSHFVLFAEQAKALADKSHLTASLRNLKFILTTLEQSITQFAHPYDADIAEIIAKLAALNFVDNHERKESFIELTTTLAERNPLLMSNGDEAVGLLRGIANTNQDTVDKKIKVTLIALDLLDIDNSRHYLRFVEKINDARHLSAIIKLHDWLEKNATPIGIKKEILKRFISNLARSSVDFILADDFIMGFTRQASFKTRSGKVILAAELEFADVYNRLSPSLRRCDAGWWFRGLLFEAAEGDVTTGWLIELAEGLNTLDLTGVSLKSDSRGKLYKNLPKDPQVIVRYLREAARWRVIGNRFNEFSIENKYPFFITGNLQSSTLPEQFARAVNRDFNLHILKKDLNQMGSLDDVITELVSDDDVRKEFYGTKSMLSEATIKNWAEELFPSGMIKSPTAQALETFLTSESHKKLNEKDLSKTRNWQGSPFGIKLLKIKMIFDMLNQMRSNEKTGVLLFFKTRNNPFSRQDAILINLLAQCRQQANTLVTEFDRLNNNDDEKMNLLRWVQGQPLFNEHLGLHRGTHDTNSVQHLKKRLAELSNTSATSSSQVKFAGDEFTLISSSSIAPPLMSSEFTPGYEETAVASSSSQSQQSSDLVASAPPLSHEELAAALLHDPAASAPPLKLEDLSDEPDEDQTKLREKSTSPTEDPASSDASGDSSGESQAAAEEDPLDLGLPDATALPDPQSVPAEKPLNMPSVPTAAPGGQASPNKSKLPVKDDKPESPSPAQ